MTRLENLAADSGELKQSSSGRDEAASLRSPTRFSLRAILVLMAICAIVAAITRHTDLTFFLVFGLPMLAYAVASYAIHHWKSSGYICLGVAMLTSLLGIFGLFVFDTPTIRYGFYFKYWFGHLVVVAMLVSLAGFLPLLVEFWLGLIFKCAVWIARTFFKLAATARRRHHSPANSATEQEAQIQCALDELSSVDEYDRGQSLTHN